MKVKITESRVIKVIRKDHLAQVTQVGFTAKVINQFSKILEDDQVNVRFGQRAVPLFMTGHMPVFVQQAMPTAVPPYVWYELDGLGNLANWKVVLP